MDAKKVKKTAGKANSGKARALALTPERRKEISQKGVQAKRDKKNLPVVTKKRDDLVIAGARIPCAVVTRANGEAVRVLTENGIMSAILGEASGASKRKKKELESEGAPVPIFLAPGQLEPFINKATNDQALLQKIEYIDGDKVVQGYDARILPIVCDIWLRAREAGALQKQQFAKAQKAEVLMRGLAHVGIVALVDEATGYQDARAKDALAQILEKFVAKELQPWVKTFPVEYYKELCRLYGVPFPPPNGNFPQFFGHITNNAIYSRLAPELLPELKKAASKQEKKARLHQYLTSDVGHPKLMERMASVVTLLKLSSTKNDFLNLVDKIHPKFNENFSFDFEN